MKRCWLWLALSQSACSLMAPTDDEVARPRGPNYEDVVLEDKPLGYWRLDDALGTSAPRDATGRMDASAVQVAFGKTGLIGQGTAATLEAHQSYIQASTPVVLAAGAPLTLEAWVKAAAVDTTTRWIASVESAGEQGFALYFNKAVLQFDQRGTGCPSCNALVNDAILVGVIRHVVASYDASVARLYVDGQLVREVPFSATVPAINATLTWGARTGALGFNHFDGEIDEVAVYDYALPGSRVRAHYDAGRGP